MVSRTAMCTLNELEPVSIWHIVARYRKKRHSSPSEVARGALRRTHGMGTGMKPGNSLRTGR